MEVVEKFRSSVKQHDAELTDLRKQVAEEDKRAREEGAELELILSKARKQREDLAGRVRPDVMKRYQHIRAKRGLAVVPVRNGTCAGCNMSIPPQLYNQLIRGEQLFACPLCHRLIYYEPEPRPEAKS
jgi:predicted  nucleic acid-binding Zn-ribbon protein